MTDPGSGKTADGAMATGLARKMASRSFAQYSSDKKISTGRRASMAGGFDSSCLGMRRMASIWLALSALSGIPYRRASIS